MPSLSNTLALLALAVSSTLAEAPKYLLTGVTGTGTGILPFPTGGTGVHYPLPNTTASYIPTGTDIGSLPTVTGGGGSSPISSSPVGGGAGGTCAAPVTVTEQHTETVTVTTTIGGGSGGSGSAIPTGPGGPPYPTSTGGPGNGAGPTGTVASTSLISSGTGVSALPSASGFVKRYEIRGLQQKNKERRGWFL